MVEIPPFALRVEPHVAHRVEDRRGPIFRDVQTVENGMGANCPLNAENRPAEAGQCLSASLSETPGPPGLCRWVYSLPEEGKRAFPQSPVVVGVECPPPVHVQA